MDGGRHESRATATEPPKLEELAAFVREHPSRRAKDTLRAFLRQRGRLEQHARRNVGAGLYESECPDQLRRHLTETTPQTRTHARDGLVDLLDLGLVDATNVSEQVCDVSLRTAWRISRESRDRARSEEREAHLRV